MNKLELLRTFVRVSELSSFTLAGESLGLPRSTVSEQVRALESLLGTRLLNRTTRRVQATQDGLHLYERSKDLLSRMDEIEGLFHSEKAALIGRLRVDLPTLMARRIILPNLPQFIDCHPGIELEISCTDRQVDLLREGFDCVLRIGTLSDLDLIARPLGFLAQINCASLRYLQRHGVPESLADLHHHQLIHYVKSLGSRGPGFEYLQAGALQVQPMAGAVTVNSTEAYESACVAGLGLIQAPAAGLQGYLDRGELVALLADFVPPPMPVSLLYARQQHVPPRLRAFMDWLAALLEPRLDQAAGGN